MNAIPLINVATPKRDNETQLRQEVNTSLVALKREAFNLETLINQAAQTLVEVNERITALENVQGDYVKKTDVTDTVQSGNMNPVTSNAVSGAISALDVSSVGGSGKYISAISEADGKISATASDLGNMVPVDSVTSGNMHSVTSHAVANAMSNQFVNIASSAISLTIAANTGTSGSFTFTVPSGYKVIGFNGYITSGPAGAINLYSYIFDDVFGKTGTFSSTVFFRNYTSYQQTALIKIYLLCARV